jgi:hypothetical protein
VQHLGCVITAEDVLRRKLAPSKSHFGSEIAVGPLVSVTTFIEESCGGGGGQYVSFFAAAFRCARGVLKIHTPRLETLRYSPNQSEYVWRKAF